MTRSDLQKSGLELDVGNRVCSNRIHSVLIPEAKRRRFEKQTWEWKPTIISHHGETFSDIFADLFYYNLIRCFNAESVYCRSGSLFREVFTMWKYMCRRQLLTLFLAFLGGFLMTLMFSSSDLFLQVLQETLPAQTAAMFTSNPYLLCLSAGLGFAGLVNVFLLGNLITTYYSGSMFLILFVLILIPDMVIMAGLLTLPVMIIVSIYGWVSLILTQKKKLKEAGINGDDDIVADYLIRHPMDEEYEPLGHSVKKTVTTVQFAYFLGFVACFCVLFFLDNIWIVMILLFVCMFAFQQLNRMRTSAFESIAQLLYDNCDPEACMSALIAYSQRGKHYKLSNRALISQCLIYLDEPKLAQDVLICYQRGTMNAQLSYYTLMGNSDYQLKDEEGLKRCAQEITRLRMPRGAMGMMIKSQQLGMLENKIHLMDGDFNESKKYFLALLKAVPYNAMKAECCYYIALISFVQEDYVVAKMYFEKTISSGGRLYYVEKAQNYLDKIAQSQLIEESYEDQ